jgi:hypothetical protein
MKQGIEQSKSKQYQKTLMLVAFCLFISTISSSGQEKLDWLEDQPPTDVIVRYQENALSNMDRYPRKSTGSIKQNLNAEQLSCFDIACRKPFGNAISPIISAKTINPNLVFLRIFCPQEWQGELDPDDKQGNGYPFNRSGPATENNEVFPGHWAYKPFTTLTDGISAESGISISVADPSKFQNGTYYYVIRPADSWEDAEQVKVTNDGSSLIINQRGYKSTAKSWPAGSIIAQHQLGNGAGNRNWVYNLSTACPEDANNKKANQVFAHWLAENYDTDGNGNPVSAIDGILYDSDFYSFAAGGKLTTRNADFDNDGTADYGEYEDGTNFWGEGLEIFYQGVRDGLDARGRENAIIVGGVADSWGIIPNNGTQLEAAWSHQFSENGARAGNYNHIGHYISLMKAHSGHGKIAPRVNDVQGKEASAIYPASSGETRNAPVRFSYAMSMLFNGTWFSNQNGFDDPFHYFDEDAVYLDPGQNSGVSVSRDNYADIRANNKWLGKALGSYQRIYNSETFSIEKNMLSNGNFEAPLSQGWFGSNCTVAVSSEKSYEGASSLLISPTIPSSSTLIDASTAGSPDITLNAGQEYSLCFAIYNEAPTRMIRVRMGSLNQTLYLPPGWTKHVLCWKQETSTSAGIRFDVGKELTPVNIDQLYLFKGSSDVFRRDFENGIILANATGTVKNIQLDGTFRRIKGKLDPVVNNGTTDITSVILPPYDGLFLIRQANPSVIFNTEACEEYTWIDGKTYTSSNSTATHYLTDTQGLDSIVRLNLVIHNNDFIDHNVLSCDPYTWINEITYSESTDNPTFTLQNIYGCDSIIRLVLTIPEIDTTLSVSDSELAANEMAGYYQWLDCNNDYNSIQGALFRTFAPEVSGNYAVRINVDGCVDTTACREIIIAGSSKNSYLQDIYIYPNPTSGNIWVRASETGNFTFSIYTLDGRHIFERTIEKTMSNFDFPAKHGVYLGVITGENYSRSFKIVKV